jgi:catechol 2,3-dioxygenase-like lactoylglutathione lyase family enzyme
MRLIGAVMVAVCAAAACAGDDVKLTIAALRLGAPDLEASAAFYQRHLDFEMAIDAREAGFVAMVNGDDWLVISQSAAPADVPQGACHVRFNFATSDLDAKAAQMRQAGVRFVEKGVSAKGRYLTFVDPAGHRHNLKQLEATGPGRDDAGGAPAAGGDEGDAAAPTVSVYNAAIVVTDMPRAREFYERTLGFTPASEDYYPPVVPYKPAATMFFILSDRDASVPAPQRPGGAWAGLSLETVDIAAAKALLEERGVRFEHEVQRSGPVLKTTFLDPFGNRMELIQHVAPDAPEDGASAGGE